VQGVLILVLDDAVEVLEGVADLPVVGAVLAAV